MALIKNINKEYVWKTALQAIKFGIVGLTNTALCMGIIFVLMRLFNVDYRISNAIGYIFGVINSFLWNKHWTFKSKNSFIRELILFVVMFLISYGIQFVSLILFKEKLNLNKYEAQIPAMVIYTATNFFLNKIFTFKN